MLVNGDNFEVVEHNSIVELYEYLIYNGIESYMLEQIFSGVRELLGIETQYYYKLKEAVFAAFNAHDEHITKIKNKSTSPKL